mmetsp:Transcript_88439/g.273795  ORF Transcript_88439/g.273795 Transcript_88439/m.273795 type:complete len:279 (-) Transcript_88439:56-892(-)
MGAVQQCVPSCEALRAGSAALGPGGSATDTPRSEGTGPVAMDSARAASGGTSRPEVFCCGGSSASSWCAKGRALTCDAPQAVRPQISRSSSAEVLVKGALPHPHDPRCREGDLKLEDGSSYRGQLLDRRRHGHGVQHSPQEHFVGQWRDDLRHGHGRHTWQGVGKGTKRMYEGQYQQGLLHGQGRMEWHTPSGMMVYEGEYVEDKKHGSGRYEWPDGRVYEGQWRRGQRWGRAEFTNATGASKGGVWQDDRVVYWYGEYQSSEAAKTSQVQVEVELAE